MQFEDLDRKIFGQDEQDGLTLNDLSPNACPLCLPPHCFHPVNPAYPVRFPCFHFIVPAIPDAPPLRRPVTPARVTLLTWRRMKPWQRLRGPARVEHTGFPPQA